MIGCAWYTNPLGWISCAPYHVLSKVHPHDVHMMSMMCKAHHRHHGVIMRVTSWDTHMISNDVRTLDVHIMSKGHDIWHQEFFHHLISCSHTHWYHMTPSDDVPSSECHGISLSMFQDHSWGCMSMIDPLGLSLCIHIRSQEPGEHSGDHMICKAYHKLLLSYSLCEVTLTSLMKHRVDDAKIGRASCRERV